MGEIRNLSQLLDALRHGYDVTKGKKMSSPVTYAAREPEKEERHFCISLAGHAIWIDSLHREVYSLCEEFLCEDEPEIRVSITEDDIAYERKEADKTNTPQSDGYLETLAVYRKISERILEYDTFLMHGAVVASGSDAYMFTAASGTGKTTHIRKWLEKLDDAYVVNGDKPLIKITDTEAIACGTPWRGKEQMGTNSMVPLRAIVLMERGEENRMEEVSFMNAFTFLLQQTYQPKEKEAMKKTLRLFSQLKGKVRFYRFVFNNMKEDSFDVSYRALTGGKT